MTRDGAFAYLLIRSSRNYPGGLSHMQLETGAQLLATVAVMRQESAEAIVGAGRRQRYAGGWKRARRIGKPGGSPH